MNDLSNKKCKPCEEGASPLNKEEIKNFLKEIENWNISEDEKIEKDFNFKNFKESLDFVNKVGDIAENENHHPDILIYNFKNVRVSLYTHKIDGLSENDFILASKIDNIK